MSQNIPDTTILKTSMNMSPANLKPASIPGSRIIAKNTMSWAAFIMMRFAVHSFFAVLLVSSKTMNPSSESIRIDKSKTVIKVTSFLVVETTI